MIFNLTSGEIFFYGGIIGMGVVAVISIICIAVLANGKKRLRACLVSLHLREKVL